MENGTVWSNSSESSDDSSSPALAHHAQRLTASNVLQTPLGAQLSFTQHKSSTSTPSLSSNQEEDETEAAEVFTQADAVPNGHLQTSCSHISESSTDCTATDRASVQSADLSDTSADLSCSCPDVSSTPPVLLPGGADVSAGGAKEAPEDAAKATRDGQAEVEDSAAEAGDGHQVETSEATLSVKDSKPAEGAPTVSLCTLPAAQPRV